MITKASFWQFTRRIQQLSTDSQGLGKRTACLANPFRLRDRAYDAANSYRYNTYSHWRHRLLYRAVLAFEGRRITTDRSREKIWEEDCFWERKGDTKSGHSQNAFATAACFVFPCHHLPFLLPWDSDLPTPKRSSWPRIGRFRGHLSGLVKIPERVILARERRETEMNLRTGTAGILGLSWSF